MIFRVSSEDVASQMVKLTFGIMLDGMMNGKVAKPKVSTTPANVSLRIRRQNLHVQHVKQAWLEPALQQQELVQSTLLGIEHS